MPSRDRLPNSPFKLLRTSLFSFLLTVPVSFTVANPVITKNHARGTPQTNAAPTQSTPTRQAQQKPTVAGTVIFAVNKYPDGITIDPIVIFNQGQYIDPLPDDEAFQKQVAAKYLSAGQKHRVIFGGAEAGTVTVGDHHEFGLTHGATLESSIKLSDEVKALATSSATLGAKQNSRRAPTPEERAAMLDLMDQAYKHNKVAASAIAKVAVNNITAIDLNADGNAELIGSFEIANHNLTWHGLFLIAEMQNGQYRSGLTWYKKGDEGTFEVRRLIDVLDLDGDGVAEVFARTSYYESTDFTIYKKVKGAWRSVYKGGLFGV